MQRTRRGNPNVALGGTQHIRADRCAKAQLSHPTGWAAPSRPWVSARQPRQPWVACEYHGQRDVRDSADLCSLSMLSAHAELGTSGVMQCFVITVKSMSRILPPTPHAPPSLHTPRTALTDCLIIGCSCRARRNLVFAV